MIAQHTGAVEKDITLTIQWNFYTILGNLAKYGKLFTDSAKKLKYYTGSVMRFYGLPKIHKPHFPQIVVLRSPLFILQST